MERIQIIQRLNDLIQLDVDAVEAYSHAIKAIKYDDIRNKFIEFQQEHQSHVQTLSDMVIRLNGTPVKPSPDMKGYLIEGLTALKSITGQKGAIEAMLSNEKVTTKKYEEASVLDLPEEILKLVKANWSHELRHLRYINELIEIPRHELR